jgi:hypothetical protein
MARVVIGSYMVRYPLGGMMSWVLQWIVGTQRLGHDVYFVEKAGYPNSCYNPVLDTMSDDASYGLGVVNDLLSRFDLGQRWCFVDAAGTYRGMSRASIEEALASADAFIDMGTHGGWLGEAARAGVRVLVDGEPGFTQMKLAKAGLAATSPAEYDRYFTTGQNIGTGRSTAPTAGREWGHVFHPVVAGLFDDAAARPPARESAAVTTVMNWQSYEEVEFEGQRYGHKNREFDRFLGLPGLVDVPCEVAVSGKSVPADRLRAAGWRVQDGHAVTISFDTFRDFVGASLAEFSVCKNGYVATNSGWFSDRSAAYLAAGRPVVMQETGFSEHLPCGAGLFAVTMVEEAADAIDEITRDYTRHSRVAREVAVECLDARVVLGRFYRELGV